MSHDRGFLNTVTNATAHLHRKRLWYYGGNYDTFIKVRAEHRANQMSTHKDQTARADQLKRFIAKFGQGHKKMVKQAQCRMKKLDKLKEEMVTVDWDDASLKINFPAATPLPPPCVSVVDTAFGYEPGKTLYENLNFGRDCDSRVAIVGPNGAGKSTFLKLVMGEIIPTEGWVNRHCKLRLAMFSQHSVDKMDVEADAVTHMRRLDEDMPLEEARAFLGRFGLSGQLATNPIKNLSGGQKSRLAFAELAWRLPHILLLDEPTNHLDLETIESLAMAINAFEGGVVLVSHDERPHLAHVRRAVVRAQGAGRQAGVCVRGDGDFDSYREMLKNDFKEQALLKSGKSKKKGGKEAEVTKAGKQPEVTKAAPGAASWCRPDPALRGQRRPPAPAASAGPAGGGGGGGSWSAARGDGGGSGGSNGWRGGGDSRARPADPRQSPRGPPMATWHLAAAPARAAAGAGAAAAAVARARRTTPGTTSLLRWRQRQRRAAATCRRTCGIASRGTARRAREQCIIRPECVYNRPGALLRACLWRAASPAWGSPRVAVVVDRLEHAGIDERLQRGEHVLLPPRAPRTPPRLAHAQQGAVGGAQRRLQRGRHLQRKAQRALHLGARLVALHVQLARVGEGVVHHRLTPSITSRPAPAKAARTAPPVRTVASAPPGPPALAGGTMRCAMKRAHIWSAAESTGMADTTLRTMRSIWESSAAPRAPSPPLLAPLPPPSAPSRSPPPSSACTTPRWSKTSRGTHLRSASFSSAAVASAPCSASCMKSAHVTRWPLDTVTCKECSSVSATAASWMVPRGMYSTSPGCSVTTAGGGRSSGTKSAELSRGQRSWPAAWRGYTCQRLVPSSCSTKASMSSQWGAKPCERGGVRYALQPTAQPKWRSRPARSDCSASLQRWGCSTRSEHPRDSKSSHTRSGSCLLDTSDAADDRIRV